MSQPQLKEKAAPAPARIFLSPPALSGREQELVAEAFASNYIAPLGPMVDAFEKELAEYTGFKHCVAVSSGTAALHLILRCIGVGQGDRVYLSDLTFIGSVTPALFQNGTPVFIDSAPGQYNMDPALVAEQLAKDAKAGTLPKVIVPTDLYGQACDLDAILEAAAPYGVPVVCDTAEALGTRYKERHAGKGAFAAALSFNGNKIITSSGGGAVLTDDAAFAKRVVYYATQAREPVAHYEHTDYGYNYRLSNISAAIGRGQFATIAERIETRRAIYQRYKDGLQGLPGVSFLEEPNFTRSTHWLSLMFIDPAKAKMDREQIRVMLETHNIESRAAWKPMHMQPLFKGAECAGGKVGEKVFEQGLCLPSGHQLSQDDQRRIIGFIRAALA